MHRAGLLIATFYVEEEMLAMMHQLKDDYSFRCAEYNPNSPVVHGLGYFHRFVIVAEKKE